ncbi:MAG: hypothetical protein LAP61_13835 [Acidobacteriia bacterium]|nr:hypothetical protein [Terriglobia bacterium]
MSTLDGRQPTFPHLREDVGICEHIDYAFEHGIDKLEIRDWKWPSKPA